MSDTLPTHFNLIALQTINGAELEAIRRAVPASEALAVLQMEQIKALCGEYGAGVVVFLRPVGEDGAVALLECAAAQQASAIELTRQLSSEAAMRLASEAGAAALRRALEMMWTDFHWRHREQGFGTKAECPKGACFEARSALAEDAGSALLAELAAARAVVAALRRRKGICPLCGFGEKLDGSPFHGKGCARGDYDAGGRSRPSTADRIRLRQFVAAYRDRIKDARVGFGEFAGMEGK